MTDIELAEKYFDEECPHSYADNREQLEEDVVQGFLAGLKARWHDLRKDPKDLPEVSPEIERTNGSKVYAIFKDRHYYLVDRAALKNYDDVIAWCELPQYKEDE